MHSGGASPGSCVSSVAKTSKYGWWAPSGDSGLGALPWRCGLAIAVASAVYRDIGRALADQQFNPLSGRAHTTLRRKLFLVARATMRHVLELPARMLVEVRVPQTVLTGPTRRLAFGQEA